MQTKNGFSTKRLFTAGVMGLLIFAVLAFVAIPTIPRANALPTPRSTIYCGSLTNCTTGTFTVVLGDTLIIGVQASFISPYCGTIVTFSSNVTTSVTWANSIVSNCATVGSDSYASFIGAARINASSSSATFTIGISTPTAAGFYAEAIDYNATLPLTPIAQGFRSITGGPSYGLSPGLSIASGQVGAASLNIEGRTLSTSDCPTKVNPIGFAPYIFTCGSNLISNPAIWGGAATDCGAGCTIAAAIYGTGGGTTTTSTPIATTTIGQCAYHDSTVVLPDNSGLMYSGVTTATTNITLASVNVIKVDGPGDQYLELAYYQVNNTHPSSVVSPSSPLLQYNYHTFTLTPSASENLTLTWDPNRVVTTNNAWAIMVIGNSGITISAHVPYTFAFPTSQVAASPGYPFPGPNGAQASYSSLGLVSGITFDLNLCAVGNYLPGSGGTVTTTTSTVYTSTVTTTTTTTTTMTSMHSFSGSQLGYWFVPLIFILLPAGLFLGFALMAKMGGKYGFIMFIVGMEFGSLVGVLANVVPLTALVIFSIILAVILYRSV